jgi:hypothetical protein
MDEIAIKFSCIAMPGVWLQTGTLFLKRFRRGHHDRGR